MQAGRRVGVATGALVLLGVGLVALDVAALARPTAPRRICSAAPAPAEPLEAARAFLGTAVEGRQLAQSYRLATPGLRQGTTCADWVSGRLPIERFGRIDWTRSAYKVVAGAKGQLVLKVLLWSPGPKREVKAYLMELRRASGSQRWRVGFWQQTPLHAGDLAAPKL